MPAGTDLEEFSGLSLNALGSVDDHDRGVCRHQGTVSIFGEILMSGRIQDIYAEPAVIELKDRRCDRDTSLLFDLHPVGDRMSRSSFSLDGARKIDRAAVQQEFFCQCCLARVRMRDNGKRSAFCYFVHVKPFFEYVHVSLVRLSSSI